MAEITTYDSPANLEPLKLRKSHLGLTSLRVKIASLVEEVRIIREHEGAERRAGRRVAADGLRDHRRFVVRSEIRASHFALAFLTGTPAHAVEPRNRQDPDSKARKSAMVRRAIDIVHTFAEKEPPARPESVGAKRLRKASRSEAFRRWSGDAE